MRACFMLERERKKESEKELRVWVCFMLARVNTPYSPVRERERKRERREIERERYIYICPELLFLIFKRYDGCLGTF